MRGDLYTWALLGGPQEDRTFPPSLATYPSSADLSSLQTPDSYGIEVDATDLRVGSAPTGASRIVKTYTVDSNTYEWHYNRLWRASGTQLIFGAPEYTANFFEHRLGHIDFLEDSENIVGFIPCGKEPFKKMVVFKSTGGYVVHNAFDDDANFSVGDFAQELFISDSDNMIELDGNVYFSNSAGFFLYDSQDDNVIEVSLPMRGDARTINQPLKANYSKKYIILNDVLVYDVLNNKFLDFSTSGFLYTSPTFEQKGRTFSEPFYVNELDFIIDKISDGEIDITIQVKFEDDDWSDEIEQSVLDSQGLRDRFKIHLDQHTKEARTFAMRITSLSSNVAIRAIRIHASGLTMESGYAA